MIMFCPNCGAYMKKYPFGHICKKCGFSKIKEPQGIILDNQDLDFYTKKDVLEKIEGFLKNEEQKITEITKMTDITDIKEFINFIRFISEKCKENIEKIGKYMELEKEILKKKISQKEKIKELRALKKSIFPEEQTRYEKLLYFLIQLLGNCIGIEIAMRFERYCGRKPENISFMNLSYDIHSKGNFEERFIEVKTLLREKFLKPTISQIDFLIAKEIIDKKEKSEDWMEDWKNELKKRWIYYVRINEKNLKYTKDSRLFYSYVITLYAISSYEILSSNNQFIELFKRFSLLEEKLLKNSHIFFFQKLELEESLRSIYTSSLQEYFQKLKPLIIIPSEQIITLLKILEQLIYALDECKYDEMFWLKKLEKMSEKLKK